MKDLPKLSSKSISHPDCCLSLSLPLLGTIAAHLPTPPALILSIGSGTGLLERLLSLHYPSLHILGVEVRADPSVNKYLPEEDIFTVIGSVGSGGATCDRASTAAVWMFVYPRSPLLIRNYLHEYGEGSVKTIIWLGPANDWADFASSLDRPGFERPQELEDCGLPPYEKMVVIRRAS